MFIMFPPTFVFSSNARVDGGGIAWRLWLDENFYLARGQIMSSHNQLLSPGTVQGPDAFQQKGISCEPQDSSTMHNDAMTRYFPLRTDRLISEEWNAPAHETSCHPRWPADHVCLWRRGFTLLSSIRENCSNTIWWSIVALRWGGGGSFHMYKHVCSLSLIKRCNGTFIVYRRLLPGRRMVVPVTVGYYRRTNKETARKDDDKPFIMIKLSRFKYLLISKQHNVTQKALTKKKKLHLRWLCFY